MIILKYLVIPSFCSGKTTKVTSRVIEFGHAIRRQNRTTFAIPHDVAAIAILRFLTTWLLFQQIISIVSIVLDYKVDTEFIRSTCSAKRAVSKTNTTKRGTSVE